MKKMKINMTFECLTWRQPIISHIITQCIETTLAAENITDAALCIVPSNDIAHRST